MSDVPDIPTPIVSATAASFVWKHITALKSLRSSFEDFSTYASRVPAQGRPTITPPVDDQAVALAHYIARCGLYGDPNERFVWERLAHGEAEPIHELTRGIESDIGELEYELLGPPWNRAEGKERFGRFLDHIGSRGLAAPGDTARYPIALLCPELLPAAREHHGVGTMTSAQALHALNIALANETMLWTSGTLTSELRSKDLCWKDVFTDEVAGLVVERFDRQREAYGALDASGGGSIERIPPDIR